MTGTIDLVLLVVAFGLLMVLFAALIFPERFDA